MDPVCTDTQNTGWIRGKTLDGHFTVRATSKNVPSQVTLRVLTSSLQMATFSLVTTLLFEFLTNVQSCLIHVHGFLIGNLYQWQRTCLTCQICSRTVFVLFQWRGQKTNQRTCKNERKSIVIRNAECDILFYKAKELKELKPKRLRPIKWPWGSSFEQLKFQRQEHRTFVRTRPKLSLFRYFIRRQSLRYRSLQSRLILQCGRCYYSWD